MKHRIYVISGNAGTIWAPFLDEWIIPHSVVVSSPVSLSTQLPINPEDLQTEGLVCTICYLGFLFQTPSGGVFAVPQQIAILIGHFSWDADLVAVEVVGLLASFTFFVDPVVYLCQRFVAAGISVDIGISAVQSGFLQYMAVAPNEASMVFEVDWNCLKILRWIQCFI